MPQSSRICGFSSIFQRLTLPPACGGVLGVLVGDRLGEGGLFTGGEPLGVLDPGIQQEEHHDAHHHGEQALEAEQPLPAADPQDIVQAQEHAGDGPGECCGDGRAGNEDGGCLAALAGGNPAGEVEDDGREEAGFGGAQQEPEDVEHHFVLHEGHQEGDDAPADHDAGQPHLGAVLLHHHVAGKFEDGVGDEEQACAEAVGRSADAHVGFEVLVGVADVGAVELVAHQHDQHDGQDPLEKLLRGEGHIRDSGVYRLHGGNPSNLARRSGDHFGRCGAHHSKCVHFIRGFRCASNTHFACRDALGASRHFVNAGGATAPAAHRRLEPASGIRQMTPHGGGGGGFITVSDGGGDGSVFVDHLVEVVAGVMLDAGHQPGARHRDHGLAQGREAVGVEGVSGGRGDGAVEFEVGLHGVAGMIRRWP